MYRINFAGIQLDEYCQIRNIIRTVLPPRENFSKQIPTMNGSFYTGYKYGERIIEAEVTIVAISNEDYINKVRLLASAIDVKNPSKLIISDEPNKYYYAVVDGETDLEKKFRTGTITIKFLCHDPMAYSVDWKTFAPVGSKITVINEGTTDTFPLMDIEFKKPACFFQATNNKGQTVLIGAPKNSTQATTPVSNLVLNDNCQSASTFTSLAEALLDSGRKITGQLGVGNSGNGIVCTNYGTGEEGVWNGASYRRSIGQNVDQFEVEIDFTFTSQGSNYTIPPAPTTPPKPSVPNSPTTNSYGSYKVVNCGGLWINRNANINEPLYPMSPGTIIYPVEISNGWAKHTHSNQWNTFTGWSSMKYLEKISDGIVGKSVERSVEANSEIAVATDYAEYEVGLLEIYGFDQNGAKLFKMEVTDTNEYYEYVEPKVYIGNSLVLDDGKNCPSPRTITTKDDSGKDTSREVESGVFGDWNDMDGKIVITREKNSKGTYLWNASVYKYRNGRIVNTMSTKNSISNSSYPKGALNYIGIYISRHGKKQAVDLIAVNNIKVRKLNLSTDQDVDGNLEIFKAGDHLQLDFSSGLVKLNDQVFLKNIDIGSEFFSIPVGRSQIAIRSDDTTINAVCGVQEKFL